MVTRKILDELFAEFGLFGADDGADCGAEAMDDADMLAGGDLTGVDPSRITAAEVERFMAAVYRNQS